MNNTHCPWRRWEVGVMMWVDSILALSVTFPTPPAGNSWRRLKWQERTQRKVQMKRARREVASLRLILATGRKEHKGGYTLELWNEFPSEKIRWHNTYVPGTLVNHLEKVSPFGSAVKILASILLLWLASCSFSSSQNSFWKLKIKLCH